MKSIQIIKIILFSFLLGGVLFSSSCGNEEEVITQPVPPNQTLDQKIRNHTWKITTVKYTITGHEDYSGNVTNIQPYSVLAQSNGLIEGLWSGLNTKMIFQVDGKLGFIFQNTATDGGFPFYQCYGDDYNSSGGLDLCFHYSVNNTLNNIVCIGSQGFDEDGNLGVGVGYEQPVLEQYDVAVSGDGATMTFKVAYKVDNFDENIDGYHVGYFTYTTSKVS